MDFYPLQDISALILICFVKYPHTRPSVGLKKQPDAVGCGLRDKHMEGRVAAFSQLQTQSRPLYNPTTRRRGQTSIRESSTRCCKLAPCWVCARRWRAKPLSISRNIQKLECFDGVDSSGLRFSSKSLRLRLTIKVAQRTTA